MEQATYVVFASESRAQLDEIDGVYERVELRATETGPAGIRPRVITDSTFVLLESLRSFRHVFRHAYGTSLDDRKVRIVLEDARLLHSILRREVETFLSAIEVR